MHLNATHQRNFDLKYSVKHESWISNIPNNLKFTLFPPRCGRFKTRPIL